VSQSEPQVVALLIGFAVLAVIVGLLLMRRLRSGRAADRDDMGFPIGAAGRPSADTPPAAGAPGVQSSQAETRGERRRPDPPPQASPAELASALRSAILRAVSERAPAGWSALVLCPPPHAEQMTWHVHLSPEVGLDLEDGRTLTVTPPVATHESQLAGGRTVRIGDGDPEPAPTDETRALRVTGPYLLISVRPGRERAPELVARVVTAEGDDLPQQRGIATDARSVQAALREAVEQAVGSRMLGVPPTVAYRPASWAGHERVWLAISP
jgi:hypothetical protein